MCRFAISALLLALLAVPGMAKDQSVEDLKARLSNATPDERPVICVQIAQHQLNNADKLYIDGDVDHARQAVDDVVAYAEKARDFAKQAKKHLKTVEIAARKMSEKLRDIQRTIAFEDQPPVQQAIQQLENVRTDLLNQMFKKDKK
jgi:hypothetical protein